VDEDKLNYESEDNRINNEPDEAQETEPESGDTNAQDLLNEMVTGESIDSLENIMQELGLGEYNDSLDGEDENSAEEEPALEAVQEYSANTGPKEPASAEASQTDLSDDPEDYDLRYLPEKSIYEKDVEVQRSEMSNEEMEALLDSFVDERSEEETMSEADMAIDNINLDELDFDFDAEGTLDYTETESEIDDEALEFIQDVTVYDTVERDDPFSAAIAQATEGFSGEIGLPDYEEKVVVGPDADGNYAPSRGLRVKEDGSKLKWWLKLPGFKSVSVGMSTLIIVLAIVIVLVGAAGVFIINTLKGMAPEKHELIDNAEPISQPRYVSNNSSSIYLTTTPALYMMDIIEIVKLISNEEMTELSFRYDVGWDKYKITLSDNKYYEYNLLPESLEKGNYGNLLKFEPLNSGISGIVFTVEEISTGIVNHFPFKFEGGLKVMPVNYLNKQKITTEDESIRLDLMNGYFSNNASDITFTFQWESSAQINFDEIFMTVGTKRMRAEKENIRSYSGGDNIDIYNVKFGSLPSLTGSSSLTFGNVYYDYPLKMKVDTAPLFKNTVDNQKIIMLGENTITLERMGIMGPLYVLVGSCINNEGERVKADYETILTLKDKSGNEYKITGDCRSTEIGADIIFDTRLIENYESIEGLNISSFELSRAKVYREDIEASLNMDNASSKRAVNDRKALEAAGEFLEAQGISSYNLVFYYWNKEDFIAEYQVFEDDKVKTSILSGAAEKNVYTFQKTLISE